jgi:hypothetical protein
MFPCAARQIAGHPAARRAVAPVGHEVESSALNPWLDAAHALLQQDVDGRDKPGHDGVERF